MARKIRNSRGKRIDDGDTAMAWVQPRPSIHRFTRAIAYADLPKPPSDGGFGVAFTLGDLPDYSEFVNLFDQYSLDWVDYTFILKSPYGVSGTPPPIIYFAEDHDSSTSPSLNDMLESQNVQVATFSADRTMIKFRVRVNTLRQVYRTALTTGYERAPPGTWIDSSQADVPHYGVKYFVQNYNTAATPATSLGVMLRYHFRCKETY